MLYALLIYADEKVVPEGMPDDERQALFAAYNKLHDALAKSDGWRGSHRLHPTETATTVQVREGRTLTTDGPFAETKEQLAGVILVECADLDEALAWAARVTGAAVGSVEVRPVFTAVPAGA